MSQCKMGIFPTPCSFLNTLKGLTLCQSFRIKQKVPLLLKRISEHIKTFWFHFKVFELNKNVRFCQKKLWSTSNIWFCFKVFEIKRNVMLTIKNILEHIKTFWFCFDVIGYTKRNRQFAICQAWHDHIGVTTVERSNPKGLSNFSQCAEPVHTWNSISVLLIRSQSL